MSADSVAAHQVIVTVWIKITIEASNHALISDPTVGLGSVGFSSFSGGMLEKDSAVNLHKLLRTRTTFDFVHNSLYHKFKSLKLLENLFFNA